MNVSEKIIIMLYGDNMSSAITSTTATSLSDSMAKLDASKQPAPYGRYPSKEALDTLVDQAKEFPSLEERGALKTITHLFANQPINMNRKLLDIQLEKDLPQWCSAFGVSGVAADFFKDLSSKINDDRLKRESSTKTLNTHPGFETVQKGGVVRPSTFSSKDWEA